MSRISPGQVYLIRRTVIDGEVRDFAVLVTSDWDGDAWLVAPFLACETPVYQGDIRTGLCPPLAVVGTGLSYVVPPAALQGRLVIGEVSEQVSAAAWDLYRHVTVGIDLPAELSEKTAPPIESPYDPRIGGRQAWVDYMSTWALSYFPEDM